MNDQKLHIFCDKVKEVCHNPKSLKFLESLLTEKKEGLIQLIRAFYECLIAFNY